MSMNKIDGSQLIPSRQLDSSQGMARSNKSDSTQGVPSGSQATESTSDSRGKTGDTVEISDKARSLMEMKQVYESGLEAMGNTEETRADKLAQVRSRLEEGFYNSSEVREKVADGVVEAFRGIDEL